jgi:hypothetical protein
MAAAGARLWARGFNGKAPPPRDSVPAALE